MRASGLRASLQYCANLRESGTPAVKPTGRDSRSDGVWLRKHGKFEATLRRGGGLGFIDANTRIGCEETFISARGKERRIKSL
jgi:hypothetical protein